MRFINYKKSILVRLFRLINKRKFYHFGNNIHVFEGVEFNCPSMIRIEDNTVIQRHSFIAAHNCIENNGCPKLSILSSSNIGPRNHIYANSYVEIGEKVITAPNVFITDCTHSYFDTSIPIIDQEIIQLSRTMIGKHSWIGYGSVIMGCSIGQHCVIGANSVVLSDIPDFSIAVGAPARVIKKYDSSNKIWLRNAF